MTQNDEEAIDSFANITLVEEAKRKCKERIENAFKELYDGDDRYKQVLRDIQDKENSALGYIKNISTNKKLLAFFGSLGVTGVSPVGGFIGNKIMTQLAAKGVTMMAANSCLCGLASISISYMFVLWKSIYDTSQIIVKEIPGILEELKQQKKILLKLAELVADGKRMPMDKIQESKVALEELNKKCAKCITKLSKWEIAIKIFKIKWLVSRKKMGWAGVALGICTAVAGIVLAATGVGSIFMGALAAGAGLALFATGVVAVKHAKECEEHIRKLEEVQNSIEGLQYLLERFEKYNEKKEKEIQELAQQAQIRQSEKEQKIQNYQNEISKWEKTDIIENVFKGQSFRKRYMKYQQKIDKLADELDLFDVENLLDITEEGFKEDINDIVSEKKDLKLLNSVKKGLWETISRFKNEWKDFRN